MLNRKVLLIEPNYKNKYPPLGLMKISAYHKLLGDEVVFYKSDKRDYIFNEKLNACINKILDQKIIFDDINSLKILVQKYLKYRHISILKDIIKLTPIDYTNTIENILRYYAFKYKITRQWDRIYITTLFTFYWKKTRTIINFAKEIIKNDGQLYVGGIAATLIPEIIAEETELQINKNIISGLLDRPSIFDDNNIIIDLLTPDYSILDTIDYKYPLNTGYLTYTTKGCTRKCNFCAVSKLEPKYKKRVSISNQIQNIKKKYSDRKDLILLDNNVLASPKFNVIIEEILSMGFTKVSHFIEPNYFQILIENFKHESSPIVMKQLLKRIFSYINDFGNKYIQNEKIRKEYYQLVHDLKIDMFGSLNKDILIKSFFEINKYIEKYRYKLPKKRYVDFNQGIDCRFINEEKMKLLSQIPIRPMRIAFDNLSLKKPYENGIRLAAKYGIKELSNYILFNYNDKPEDLWYRLKINVDLHNELDSNIFSFPMKYIPLYGKESLDRSFIGPHWNKKYIRAIQCILNVTKGIGMPGGSFFKKAFGKDIDEYFNILILPEPYILYRFYFEEVGLKEVWLYQYKNLNSKELLEANEIIFSNDFFNFNGTTSKAVVEFIIKHYQLKIDPRKLPKDNLTIQLNRHNSSLLNNLH
jgi:hypothetical protein